MEKRETREPRTPARRALLRLLAAGVLLLPAIGCVASSAFRQAEKEAHQHRWDEAVINYSKAVSREPDNVRYRVALARARMRAAQEHFEKAKRYLEGGHLEFALGELQQAALLDPGNQHIETELSKAQERLAALAGKDQKSDLERMKEKAKLLGREAAKLNPSSNIPIVLKFRDHEVGKIYDALSKASGINFLYDAQIDLKKKISIDVSDVPFEKAMEILMMTNKHFFKIMDAGTLIIAQDTRQKRQEYQDLVIKTFYLSNAEVKDVQTLLRTLLDARKVAQSTQLNAITIRDTPEIVQVAEKIIESNDKAKAELLVDVELLEINRSTLQTLGINLSSQTTGVTFQGPTGGVPLNNLQLLRQSGNWVLGPIPGVTIDFLRSDSDTKVIAKPQMRVTEGEKANIHIGDRVPIPTTTFNTSNTVGGSVVPITSFVYQEIGIIIDIEPRVHHNKEVTMKLRVEVSALGPSISTGSGQSQPTIQSREIETVIRLRDGETNLLAGLIQEVEQESTSGVAGISQIPWLKRIFSRNNKDRRATDIVLTLTPHIIRIPDIRDEDLKALWIGTEQNIQLSGASRQSAFGAGPFAPAAGQEGEEEGVEEEGAVAPEGAAAEEPPPAAAPAAAAEGAAAAGPPPAPGVTVAQPQALEQQAPAAAQPEPGAQAAPEPQEAAPPVTPPPEPAAEPQMVQIGVSIEPVPASLPVGGRTVVEIQVSGAENLHSTAVTILFDPSVLKFESGTEGDLLNAGGAATAFSVSAAGGNRVAVSVARVSDPTGVSGSGRIATLVFSGVAAGSSPLSVESASVQDPSGRPLNATLSSPSAVVVQ